MNKNNVRKWFGSCMRKESRVAKCDQRLKNRNTSKFYERCYFMENLDEEEVNYKIHFVDQK